MAREKRFDWKACGHAELISELSFGHAELQRRKEELEDAERLLASGGLPSVEILEDSEVRRVS